MEDLYWTSVVSNDSSPLSIPLSRYEERGGWVTRQVARPAREDERNHTGKVGMRRECEACRAKLWRGGQAAAELCVLVGDALLSCSMRNVQMGMGEGWEGIQKAPRV